MEALTLLINYSAVAITFLLSVLSATRLSVVPIVLIFSGCGPVATRRGLLSMYVCTLCSRWDAISYFHYLFNHIQRTTPLV
jgi:hypothetical protein